MSAGSIFGEYAMVLLTATVSSLSMGIIVFQILIRNPSLVVGFRLEDRRARFLVHGVVNSVFGAFLLVYVIVFSWLMVLKHQTFHTGYDFSIFDQVIWNSLHGRLFETSITHLSSSWLGTHFAPILLALVPLYAIRADPQILLIFQTLALAFTAFPLYWLARKWLGNLLAVTITFAFFLFPALGYVNLAEFHEIALATPLLALAVYFLVGKRWIPFLVSFLLTLLLREEIAFIAIAFGFIILFQGRPRLGLGLVVFGLFWALVLFQYVIPYFSTTKSYVVTGFHYASFGNSPIEVVYSILSKPDLVLRTIFTPTKAEFILHLLVPLAFLPIVGLEVTALALPTLGYLLLAGEAQSSIRFQYPAPIIPFLFMGTIVGLHRVLRWSTTPYLWRGNTLAAESRLLIVKLALTILLLVTSLMGYYLYAPGPLARNFNVALFMADPERDTLARSLIAQVPKDAALLTYGGLTPHLSHRSRIYYYPFVNDFRQAEYLLVDTLQCYWCKEDVDAMLASGYFETLFDQSGFLLARRRPFEHSLQIRFGEEISLFGFTIVPTGTLRGGQTLRPILGWRSEHDLSKPYLIKVYLLDQRGHVWAQDEHESQKGPFPPYLWRQGERVNDQYTLRLPSTMPPDDYSLFVEVHDPAAERTLVTLDAAGQSVGDAYALTTLRIEKDKSSITASQLRDQYLLEQPYYVDMQEVRLLGFKPMPATVTVGSVLPVGLYWRARAKPRGDYVVTVQLRDAVGRVAFEHRERPAEGTYPTTQWVEGEVLLDWHDLILPTSLAPGPYSLWVCLNDANGATLGETSLTIISVVEP
jgi:uncharacterized membrane protein